MAVGPRYEGRFERDIGGSGRGVITVPGGRGWVTEADTIAHGLH